jgi:hypothetical protein
MTVKDELKRMWKETLVVSRRIHYPYLSGKNEENYKKNLSQDS